MSTESHDEDRQKRIEAGLDWLKKIFGDEQVKLVRRHSMDLIEVNHQKYLRPGCSHDDIVHWLGSYLKEKGAVDSTVFKVSETGILCLTADSFNQVGLVNALGHLHRELAELKIEQMFPPPVARIKPTPQEGGIASAEDLVEFLGCSLDDIPTSMRDLLTQMEDAKAPKTKATPLSDELCLVALKDATGVEWAIRKTSNMAYFCTLRSFENRDNLSAKLRFSLGHSKTKDLPDFSLGGEDYKKLAIPKNYIDGSNLGALVESKEVLFLLFTGREPGTIDPPTM